MAAEIFVPIATGSRLVFLLHYGREPSAMDQFIGVMLVIVAIGLPADKLLFSPWENFIHRRWGTARNGSVTGDAFPEIPDRGGRFFYRTM